MEIKPNRLSTIFSSMKDHRVNRTRKHSLENIIFITLAGVIAGCETWNDIENFGKDRFDWLSRHLDLPNGIPSHDTFNRFFSSLDPEKFEECFRKWAAEVQANFIGDSEFNIPNVVAIDGKSIRGCKTSATSALHMVSAWSKNAGITLGQIKTPDKKSEISVIPELLDALYLKNAVVTIDALGAIPTIASKIIDKEADYILQVKANRKKEYPDLKDAFESVFAESIYSGTIDAHGRIEERTVSVIRDISLLKNAHLWNKLSSLVMIERIVTNKKSGEVDKSKSYYITSLSSGAKSISYGIQSHWGIESMHWLLDAQMNEDASRKRNHNAVVNWSLLNKMALAALTKEKSFKQGTKSKRLKAAISEDYLMRVMNLF